MNVAIIGAGPGGYEAALYAAKQGCQVTLVEKDSLGGTCLNRGCIPTKSLLAVTDNLHAIAQSETFCTKAAEPEPDFGGAAARKDKIVEELAEGIGFLLNTGKVNVLQGTAKMKDKSTLVVKKDGYAEELTPDKIILATGSVPAIPVAFGYDGERVITSDEALSLRELPASMIIVGGGVIGCEIGQYLARMGCRVTILEQLSHLLPQEDKDVAKQLERRFQKESIAFVCNQGVASVEKETGAVCVTLQNGERYTAEKVLLSIGRRPATAGIGLEEAGIVPNVRGFIPVDGRMRTAVEGIYAVGDIVPSLQLAHAAVREAFVAVDDIVGNGQDICYRAIPRCVYTSPEVASVGLTEEQAEQKRIAVAVGRFDFQTLGKAKAAGKTDGFVKLVADERDVLVGGAIVGAHATEMLQVITLAVHLGVTARQLGEVVFPHPTMSEAIMETAHDLHRMSVHKVYR